MKEATARIKINKLLEAAGWRFFAEPAGPANIRLEPSAVIQESDLTALGQNFEKTTKGFIDFLLLNEKGFPFIVLEVSPRTDRCRPPPRHGGFTSFVRGDDASGGERAAVDWPSV